jgi:hypothetical protein
MEFLLDILSSIDTASAKSWVFVVLIFVSSFAIAIIILGLFTKRFKKRKEKIAHGNQRELFMVRLDELTGKTKDKETKAADIQ